MDLARELAQLPELPLELVVFDAAGKMVATADWQVNAGNNRREFGFASLGRGLYFTRIAGQSGYAVMKMEIR